MERAVPSTMRFAASMSSVFKSANFSFAISSTCEGFRVPAVSRGVAPDPFLIFRIFLIISLTGGRRSSKSNDRSS